MQRSSRVEYDAIAPLYDSQPGREKSPDPALAAFLAERSALGTGLLLDIACGTGNQLVANRAIASSARMVGFDGSLGMLRQARAKSAEIGWVHGDSSACRSLQAGSILPAANMRSTISATKREWGARRFACCRLADAW